MLRTFDTHKYNFVSAILEPFHGASPYIYNTYKYNFVSAILEPFHGASPYIYNTYKYNLTYIYMSAHYPNLIQAA
jgi:hypothetical protein